MSNQSNNSLVGKVLILKLSHDKAFLTVNKQLETSSLKYHSQLKHFKEHAFWILRVLKHDPFEKKMHVAVIEYHVGDISFPTAQTNLNYLLDQIEFITFNKIDTVGLLETRSGKIVKGATLQNPSRNIEDHMPITSQNGHNLEQYEDLLVPQGPQITTETIKVKIVNTLFVDNGVRCTYWNEHKGVFLDFIVSNPNIKKEFEAVKSYFIKALGTRHFNVVIDISEDAEGIKIINSSSKEIDRIDSSIIENVTFDCIKTNISKYRNIPDDKGFIDLDKLKEIKDGQQVTHLLPIDDDNLIELVLLITKAKHYKNIKFLAKRHKSHVMKLRYFPKPFSFIFLLEGKENYVFIWETLKTKEATYLWNVEKTKSEAKAKFHQIESDIKQMRDAGKLKYLDENSDNCTRVYHDYSDPDMGFLEWTKSIEKHLEN